MRVIALDPYASPAIAQSANVSLVTNMDELLVACDWLTIHTPLMASTKGLISAKEISKMKPRSRLLNVARGGVINENDLFEALESGHIAGAGIDVFTSEPPESDSPAAKLIAHPRVVATPHLGASTVEAQENVSIDVCEQVVAILAGDLPRSAVSHLFNRLPHLRSSSILPFASLDYIPALRPLAVHQFCLPPRRHPIIPS